MTNQKIQHEALSRATQGQSLTNYPAIFRGFEAKGIPSDQINPRENVFSYSAWQALGRQVKRGEHGVKILTLRTVTKEDKKTGKKSTFTMPWRVTVFHVSQTEEIK